jgi:hypothetical protein
MDQVVKEALRTDWDVFRTLFRVFCLPHIYDEITSLRDYKHLGFGMQWNLAARAVFRTF